jgi:hypothetical protein
MRKRLGSKKINDKKSSKNDASPVKIAYYIQRMLEKKMDRKEILLMVLSQFNKKDLKRFADVYRYCFYIEDIRRIANLIYNIPKKNMDKAMDMFAHDIIIKQKILPKKYIEEYIAKEDISLREGLKKEIRKGKLKWII